MRLLRGLVGPRQRVVVVSEDRESIEKERFEPCWGGKRLTKFEASREIAKLTRQRTVERRDLEVAKARREKWKKRVVRVAPSC